MTISKVLADIKIHIKNKVIEDLQKIQSDTINQNKQD